MSEKKLVLDDTIDTYSSGGSNNQSEVVSPFAGGSLLSGVSYDDSDEEEGLPDNSDIQSVDEEYMPNDALYGDSVEHSVQDVQEELADGFDTDLSVDVEEVAKQEDETVAKLQQLLAEKELSGTPRSSDNTMVSADSASSVVNESPAGDNVVESHENVPENIVKPIKVIDVVRKGLNATNKGFKGGSGRSTGSGKKTSSKGKSEPQEPVRTCHVKGIPRILMDMITMDFKAGSPKNQTDALVAWIVCHCEEDKILQIAPTLTQDQIDLIEGWENTPNAAIQEKLDKMMGRLQTLLLSVDTLKLLTAYEAFDRMGFRDETPRTPGGFNFMESGVLDVILRAEEQTPQMRNDRTIRKGRPIR